MKSIGLTLMLLAIAGAAELGAASLNWSAVTTESGSFTSVAASPERVVALKLSATSGQIISWPIGSPITTSRRNYEGRILSLAYGNGLFVVGTDGPMLTSSNGVDWAEHQTGVNDLASQLVFENGVFVGKGTRLLLSTNGVDWSSVASPEQENGRAANLFAAGGLFFLAQGGGTNFLSADGLTWSAAPSGTEAALYTITYGEGKYIAISHGHEILISPDAKNWTAHGKLGADRRPQLAWGNGLFVAVGGSARAVSTDGVSWTTTATAYTEYDVVFAGGRFYSGGYGVVHRSDPVTTLEVNHAGGIEIFGTAGISYELQSSDRLGSDAVWRVEQMVTVAAGEERVTWAAPEPLAGARFFRVTSSP